MIYFFESAQESLKFSIFFKINKIRSNEMGSLLNRKREKVFSIFNELNNDITFELFVKLYKKRYPSDWEKIIRKFEEEEKNTLPGKRHPMPNPDNYMKNMYRNYKGRWDREKREKSS